MLTHAFWSLLALFSKQAYESLQFAALKERPYSHGIIGGMLGATRFEPIDYLVIGHLTRDILPGGERIGGSAAYAALTAQAFGQRAGILTAWGEEIPLGALEGIPIANLGADHSTTFQNTYTKTGREQRLLHLAPPIEFHSVPEAWRNAAIVHLAPVMGEVSPRLAPFFRDSTLGITPQGWLREWREDGRVQASDWPEADHILAQSDAAVISLEDVNGDEGLVQRMATAAPILAVTEAAQGTRVYVNGEEHALLAPQMKQLDPTGAGDIFATAFFIRLHYGDSPLEAARVATDVAARSVGREGLASTPTPDEIYDLFAEAL
ncbi:MAG: ribokinase [Chloroflexi bacterium]|nr:ribokinase [Chloroflexota bacterium]